MRTIAAAPLAFGQVTKLQYPPLTITGSALASAVTYDPATQIYRYEYTVNAASANKSSIGGFTIDLLGTVNRPQLDPALPNNIEREETVIGTFQPSTTVPVGITVPNTGWYGAMSAGQPS